MLVVFGPEILLDFLYTLFDKKLGYAEVTTNCIPRFTFKAVKNILFVALPDIQGVTQQVNVKAGLSDPVNGIFNIRFEGAICCNNV